MAWQQAAGQRGAGGGSGGSSDGSGAAGEGAEEAEGLAWAARHLAAAAQPLYSRLFVPISQQPGGIKFLVDLRADLLDCVQQAR